jgi:hypothetical protein
LRQFFGSKYEEYALRTPSGVPFVKWNLMVSAQTVELIWCTHLASWR